MKKKKSYTRNIYPALPADTEKSSGNASNNKNKSIHMYIYNEFFFKKKKKKKKRPDRPKQITHVRITAL